jgi:hypothetical protein
MNSKKNATITFICCLVAALIFTIAWGRQFIYHLQHPVFSGVLLVLWGFFIVEGFTEIENAEDPNKDWKLKAIIAAAALICLWCGGWAAGYNERVQVQKDADAAKKSAQNFNQHDTYYCNLPGSINRREYSRCDSRLSQREIEYYDYTQRQLCELCDNNGLSLSVFLAFSPLCKVSFNTANSSFSQQATCIRHPFKLSIQKGYILHAISYE